MPKAYWFAHVDVTGPGGLKEYVEKSTAAVALSADSGGEERREAG